MDFAEHGMNGQLAWTQGTGMPMRPAMSVMMTADVAADRRRRRRRRRPPRRCPTDVRARASRPGWSSPSSTPRPASPVEDLTRSHEAWMHLIATRDDLGTFAHVHPSRPASPGELAVDITFPTAGRYIVNTEFRRQGEMADVHDRQLITVAGAAPGPGRPLAAGPRERRSSTASASSSTATPTPGGPATCTSPFTDAATGRPVDDLQPYLAAAGHIVVMRADGQTFAHEHAEVDRRRRPPGVRAARHHVRPRARRARRVPHRRRSTSCGRSSGSPTATSSPSRSPCRPKRDGELIVKETSNPGC